MGYGVKAITKRHLPSYDHTFAARGWGSVEEDIGGTWGRAEPRAPPTYATSTSNPPAGAIEKVSWKAKA